MSRPGRVGGLGVFHGDLLVAPRQGRAGGAGRGEVAHLCDGEVAVGEQLTHHAADLPGRADDSDAETVRRMSLVRSTWRKA